MTLSIYVVRNYHICIISNVCQKNEEYAICCFNKSQKEYIEYTGIVDYPQFILPENFWYLFNLPRGKNEIKEDDFLKFITSHLHMNHLYPENDK